MMVLSDFDILKIDSGKIDLGTPEALKVRLQEKLLQQHKISSEMEASLRLIVDAALAANLMESKKEEWLSLIETVIIEDNSLGQMVDRHESGITSLRLGRKLVVLLPNIQSEQESEHLVDALNEIQSQNTSCTEWVIDMSTVPVIPPVLAAYLIGFQIGLKNHEGHLSLLWLREGSVPETLLPSVMRHFHLVQKGAFLLSKDPKGS